MEATPEQVAEGLGIVRVLAAVLDRLVCANAHIALTDPGQVTKFHALKAPGIPILQYLERIHKYASCSNECFILALIYVDRLIQRNNFLLTELNVHRVIITAILLAAKFFDDAYYNNAYYAKVGGVLVSEMNGLEVDFLFRINFSLHVTPDLFGKYRAELVSHSLGSGYISPPPPFLDYELPTKHQLSSPLVQPTLILCAPPVPPPPQGSSSSSMMSGGVPLSNMGCNTATTTMMTREAVPVAQITPSPPHGISAIPPPLPHVVCVNDSNLTASETTTLHFPPYGIDPHLQPQKQLYMGPATPSNICADFLQHANSISVNLQNLTAYHHHHHLQAGQSCRSFSPHCHYNAATIPVSQVNGGFPFVPMSTNAAMATTMTSTGRLPNPNTNDNHNSDPLVIVDGQMYRLQNTCVGGHYKNVGMDVSYMDVMQQQQEQLNSFHHVQQPRRHSDHSFAGRDGVMMASAVPASTQFIGAQIITGMSGH